ncbi:MAG: AAA family ATPase [Treponema sp.]|nr:AAA family ATPase [Treponema sp.]
MLSAVGFKHGNLIAREAKKQIKNISTFENEIYEIFRNPKDIFSKKIAKDVTQTLCDTFLNLDSEKKSLFWLLARINLSEEQAKVLFNKKSGTAYKIELSDKEIIENPYVLYEKTRICKQSFQISVNKIDTAIFPNSIIADENPVPEPSFLDSPDDKRRIRALAVNVLEIQAQNGHTVYPQTKLAEDICNLPFDEDKQCEITSDVLNNLKNFFSEEIVCIDCDDNTIAYQLCRLNKIDEFIRSQITQRLENERFEIKEDWEKIVNNAFDKLLKDGEKIDEKEKAARKEKTAILQELAESSLSVLIGGAGTGKTTLLALLCKSEKVREGEVLLLAPTGKARVRMSKTMNDQGVQHKAQTIAQFLIRNHRYDWNTCQYRMADLPAKDVPATVIIDESSMMTEEMFGAVLDALKPAKRIIFVGDPNQLPPIGAGRPFVDLVRFLNHDLPPFPEPQVKKGFGKLTITRRQADDGTTEREDSELALWFKESEEALDEQIFTKLQNDSLGKYVSFDTWTTPEELEEKIFKNIAKETEMADPDDIEGFDKSLGGILNNGWMNFGMNPSKIEKWQVLSPYKSDVATGTGTINRYIHDKYRSKEAIEKCNYKRQSTPKLLGTDGITYGEKVINTRNQEKDGYLYDKFLIEEEKKKNVLADCLNYVANGEMGIVERIWAKSKGDKFDTHQIRFSSQPFHNYNWYSKVAQEGNCDIELAYALTVHKSQGSEFETVILVLSEPSRMISRELLYTALTRQKNKIVILYNEDAYKLKNYSSVEFSDIARRFTCLFEKPKIVEYKSRFYEEKLIHKTKRGELVRSKSEVIIANMLFDSGVDYEYEKELKLSETEHRSPDFTIFKGGKEIYWEHLGMLGKESYDRDWNAKRHQYEKYGITVANKNLIISKDGRDGSIDCEEIQKQIDELLK